MKRTYCGHLITTELTENTYRPWLIRHKKPMLLLIYGRITINQPGPNFDGVCFLFTSHSFLQEHKHFLCIWYLHGSRGGSGGPDPPPPALENENLWNYGKYASDPPPLPPLGISWFMEFYPPAPTFNSPPREKKFWIRACYFFWCVSVKKIRLWFLSFFICKDEEKEII